jgi:hypothetical protein
MPDFDDPGTSHCEEENETKLPIEAQSDRLKVFGTTAYSASQRLQNLNIMQIQIDLSFIVYAMMCSSLHETGEKRRRKLKSARRRPHSTRPTDSMALHLSSIL